jgi:hypothetical protein
MPSAFFGENSPAWADMSDYVVHFTKPYEGKDPYFKMMGILCQRIIYARNPFGAWRNKAPDISSQKAACFSEIPLHLLSRLAEKRSEFGIVFKKDFVIHRNGNPVFYAYKDQTAANAVKKLVEIAENDGTNPIWEVTPFIDAPGVYTSGTYFFEWEREWRKVGDFKFSTDDVEFLIIPETQHKKAKAFFINAHLENLGPHYDCPLIDAHWEWEKIKPLLPKKPKEG